MSAYKYIGTRNLEYLEYLYILDYKVGNLTNSKMCQNMP